MNKFENNAFIYNYKTMNTPVCCLYSSDLIGLLRYIKLELAYFYFPFYLHDRCLRTEETLEMVP